MNLRPRSNTALASDTVRSVPDAVAYEQFGDPETPVGEPTQAHHRAQREAERLRDAARRSHFHEYTVGENARTYFSHTHHHDEPDHVHPGEQAYPFRSDGGFWQESGPCLGTSPPAPVAAHLRAVVEQFARLPPADPSQLATWRLRLYCGHLTERTAHASYTSVAAAFHGTTKCPACGLDLATIVAGRVVR